MAVAPELQAFVPRGVLAGRYRLGPELGRGAHAIVYRAEDLGRGGRRVALKLTASSTEGQTFFSPAAERLQDFRHPNWAEVLDAGISHAPREGHYQLSDEAPPGPASFQVQRLIPGRGLDQIDGPVDPEHVWFFLEDGARVLQALHDHGLIHYDVTPSNWLVEGDTRRPVFTLTDGSLARIGPIDGPAIGTPRFLAPELTKKTEDHDHRVDLYSLGLIAYRLLTGQDALSDGTDDPYELIDRRRRLDVPAPSTLNDRVPRELDTLVLELLQRDPAGRPADGRAILRRIGELRDRAVPEILPSEAFARVESGTMVGQAKVLARGHAAMEDLARQLTSWPGMDARRANDYVLLLEGASGAGVSRTACELVCTGRRHGLPVLLLAGRDGAPDAESPMGLLFEALRSLLPKEEGEEESAESTPPVDPATWSEPQLIEQFVETCLEAAKCTPYVVVVEDYKALPKAARAAVDALSRELLSRRAHIATELPPPIGLVVDLGDAEAGPLLIPDIEDVRAPVSTVLPLASDELQALLQERLPLASFSTEDIAKVAQRSNARAGIVVELMSEGAHRGDVTAMDGVWSWHLEHLESYAPKPHLSPRLLTKLEDASEELRALLACFALAPGALEKKVVDHLLAEVGFQYLPPNALFARKRTGAVTLHDLSVEALRTTIRDGLTDEERGLASKRLHKALQRAPTLRNLLLRVQLADQIYGPDAAWKTIEATADRTTPRERYALQPLLLDLVKHKPKLLRDRSHRACLAMLLVPTSDGVTLARLLADQLPVDGLELPAVLAVGEVLVASSMTQEAEELLGRHAKVGLGPHATRCDVEALRAKLLFDDKRFDAAREVTAHCRQLMRATPRGTSARSRLTYLLAGSLARCRLLDNKPEHAQRYLSLGAHSARTWDQEVFEATFLNNLGIIEFRQRNVARANRSFEAAIALKLRAGDVVGALRSTMNLCRAQRERTVDASLTHARLLASTCVDKAQRHGLPQILVEALLQLAETYDDESRADLALATYLRAWRITRGRDNVNALSVAWRLGPLAAALGRRDICEEVLAFTARSARAELSSEHHGNFVCAKHYFTHALVAFYLGDAQGMETAIHRAHKRQSSLPTHMRTQLTYLKWAVFQGKGLPPMAEVPARVDVGVGRKLRHLYRIYLWILKLDRASASGASRGKRESPRRPLPSLPSGQRGRLASGLLLAAAWWVPNAPRAALFALLATHARTSACRMLAARTEALRGLLNPSENPSAASGAFSSAVSQLDELPKSSWRSLSRLPAELSAAAKDLVERLHHPVVPPLTLPKLHEIAHKALVRFGNTSQSDPRHALAIQRALDASEQIRIGGPSEALFSSLTAHIIEITGAQRACVILMQEDGQLVVRASSGASQPGGSIGLSDLSQTVIRKVQDNPRALRWSPVPAADDADPVQGLSDIELMNAQSIELARQSILCVPMLRRGKLYGMLYADNHETALAFNRFDREVLTLFADQATTAVEAQQLLEKVHRSLDEVRELQQRLVTGERLRTMGEISSGVAHEFNNLLTAILARLQYLTLHDLPEETRQEMRLIEKAAHDAAEVVRRLQSFSRRQRQAHFTDVDMGEVCQDALEILAPLWRRRAGPGGTLDVQFQCAPGLTTRGSPTELREVMTNLIKNAIEAVGNAGRITVEGRMESGEVVVRVRDDGPGIPADVRARVFEEFFTTKGEAGTGLGLSLSRQIIDRHGGHIEVETERSLGTTFCVRLPAVETAPAARGTATLERMDTDKTPVRILVVDDEPDVRTPIVRYLERLGHEVRGAEDGERALRVLEAWIPQVVLSDIGMPGIDGIELCKRILSELPDLPVVLMSGLAGDEDVADRAWAAGAHEVIAKPLRMLELNVRLQRAAIEK